MRIEIKNVYLLPTIEFMRELKLKGEKSRARSKFINLVTAAFESFRESEMELAKEFAVLDNDGNPIVDDDGGIKIKSPGLVSEFLTEHNKLKNEVAVINSGTYTTHLEQLKSVLIELDDGLSGEAAEIYDILYDALEESQND